MPEYPPIDCDRPDYQLTELPPEWHTQDWLLILDALEEYLWTQAITDGQELRLCLSDREDDGDREFPRLIRVVMALDCL